jgi:hypothetical protein
MPEAWELAPETIRQADETITFILFCEDEVNEPSYFRTFQKPGKVKVNVVEKQLSNFRNIVNTLFYCEQNGLLDKVNNGFVVKSDVTKHIWSVFDRDVNLSNPQALAADNIQFTASIQMAEHAGIKVAWSNDVFELWILLHFEDVQPGIAINRVDIYTRLTAVFKTIPDQSAEMLAITSRPDFYYKIFFKRRTEFNLFVKPYLAPRLHQAIQRAEALETAFNAQHVFHDMNPCSKVHRLVNSLLSFH